MCTNVTKNIVDYYTNQGSHVFLCFICFSKAYDKVNYWKFVHKVLDDHVSSDVGLLTFWYSNQSSRIRWKSTLSAAFTNSNGTRQGGILSPYLFTRYMRELIYDVSHFGVGCNIGGAFYNMLAYADDGLLAPSWGALQHLINLLSSCAAEIDMSCNASKTVCIRCSSLFVRESL